MHSDHIIIYGSFIIIKGTGGAGTGGRGWKGIRLKFARNYLQV